MRRLLTLAIIAISLVIAFTSNANAQYTEVAPSRAVCHTHACFQRVCKSVKCKTRVYHKRWTKLQKALPQYMKNSLAVLRGCETRGIPYPQNYQYDGHHDGAYQYLPDTWHRAGGTGFAYNASPAEQDVRTARFWPSHKGEWACKV